MEEFPKKDTAEQLGRDWDKLQQLLEYLTSLGLKTRNLSRDYFDNFTVRQGMPTPLAGLGGDGIRISYDRRRGLLLWFTNEFEDPDDETRKKVKEYWDSL